MGTVFPSMHTKRQSHFVVQKEKARSRQRMKALEEELTRMRTMQESLNRKIKANTEVGYAVLGWGGVRCVGCGGMGYAEVGYAALGGVDAVSWLDGWLGGAGAIFWVGGLP